MENNENDPLDYGGDPGPGGAWLALVCLVVAIAAGLVLVMTCPVP